LQYSECVHGCNLNGLRAVACLHRPILPVCDHDISNPLDNLKKKQTRDEHMHPVRVIQ
jgi:hypothetical protein